jgi:predicted transcriptional regulator
MRQERKKSMTLGGLTVYLEDLVQMGFVYEYCKDEKVYYKLTEMGVKSGLRDLPKMKSQKNRVKVEQVNKKEN